MVDHAKCNTVIALAERVNGQHGTIQRLEADGDKQWDEINSVKKAITRMVPVWVASVMMAMSALTASALTFASMIFKFSSMIK